MSVNKKVIVIGNGRIGSNYVYSMALQGIADEIGIIDLDKEKVQGDALDLNEATFYSEATKVYAADYSDCSDADLILIVSDTSRYSNSALFKFGSSNVLELTKTLKKVINSRFNGIFLVAADPVNVLTYETMRITGFPRGKVIGLGSVVDTSRLKNKLAKLVGIDDPRKINIYMLGDQGSEEFAAYNAAFIGNSSFLNWCDEHLIDGHTFLDAESYVKQKSQIIMRKKHSIVYGVSSALTLISNAILNDHNTVMSVSTCLEGEYGFGNVCLATPAVIGSNGINNIVELPLSNLESEKMQRAVKMVKGNILEELMSSSSSYF
nr:L-lactate dehydrogenase [Ligilactobacillus pobuzihii]